MKQKILVVDDSEDSRYLVERILTDFEVLGAANSADMRIVLERELPTLILMDVMMPHENGFDVARALNDDVRYKSIPIIFLTALDSGEDVAKGFDSGAEDYIKKPYDETELRARIKSVIAKKHTEQELKLQTLLDSLTGLYNHAAFMDLSNKLLSQGIREGKSVALAILDLDFFKNVNDSFGHQAGDFILCNFSELLGSQVRRHDLVGRYGGEEFVILFYDCTNLQAAEIIERVRLHTETSVYLFQNIKIRYTFSGGVVDTTEYENITSVENLIRIADQRLYHAKKLGRNRIALD